MKEIIQEARNVEEAIDLACKALDVDRDLIEFEIITLPKRGFLGLKNTPAKVRVYVEEPEEPVKPVVQEKPERKSAQPAERPVQPKTERRERPKQEPKKEQPKQAAEKPAEKPAQPAPEVKFMDADEVDGKARTAADYVKSVLSEMGVDAKIAVGFTENGIILRLSGEGLGVIIGRRGETLDALQYLSGLVANRQEGDYIRVTIDSGNYREKRERTLEQLAKKLSNSAIRRGRATTLEPMNPYERRIIHATVSKIDGVSSTSIGEEPNRRVVITPDNVKTQAPRGGKNQGRGGNRPPRRDGERRDGSRGGRDNRDNRSRDGGNRPGGRYNGGPRRDRKENSFGETVKPTPTDVDREYAKEIEREAPVFVKPDQAEKPAAPQAPVRETARKEGDDLPLYGKIEL
ncbi:RNA-binding cell elongation regulator Jag/EloR [Anaerotruncus rubiinfantis]|jgi:spoIIIJ-associated protein|uniref:RNA-binding cell elongation regulator Jag/EloR n=1 Tax=Anaerotruncus rubiinfantis TaxID=1720200 RepID=UPI00189B18D4|nr:RNA-binding cell elongation regulator Jag/EloR [Anaerotruncus rubiinfantis]